MIGDPIRTEEPNAVTNRKTDGYSLLSFENVGQGSVDHLRKSLGLLSTDGIRRRYWCG
jgi:hypothetical protein